MSATTFRAALMGVSMLALNACVSITVTHEVETVPVAAAPAVTVTPARESTAFTLGTDQPRTPEQAAHRRWPLAESAAPPRTASWRRRQAAS